MKFLKVIAYLKNKSLFYHFGQIRSSEQLLFAFI